MQKKPGWVALWAVSPTPRLEALLFYYIININCNILFGIELIGLDNGLDTFQLRDSDMTAYRIWLFAVELFSRRACCYRRSRARRVDDFMAAK